MRCPKCGTPTRVDDSRPSEAPETMSAQSRVLQKAIGAKTRLPERRYPFRLRRRKCEKDHVTWTIEIDRDLLLLLIDRLDLDDNLP